ncbi:MAG: hypothetical protein AABM67_07045 [Acidobacteriota bacterium]
MKRLVTCLMLLICFACNAFSQDKALEKAASNGKPVPTQITVRNNVSAEAVLIPQDDVRRIFGKEIANHYAVIEVNVGNKSPDAALIIHGVFIDYTGWGLSGTGGQAPPATAANSGNPFANFQSSTNSGHVASEEYRIVRDQAQNASLFSGRSWTMRALTLAANIAGAYPFGLSKVEVRYFSAFSGVLVPGIEKLWPDDTSQQLLRISDYGYRTNKVIPKESAEIVVCFFPIDRFLTPGFRTLFLRSPALFFAPLQMLVDRKLGKSVDGLLKTINKDLDRRTLAGAMPCYIRIIRDLEYGPRSKDTSVRGQINRNADETCLGIFGLRRDPKDSVKIDLIEDSTAEAGHKTDKSKKEFEKFLALDFIAHMSLNYVTVTVDGAMTIDTSSMAPKLEGLKFDSAENCGGDQIPCFWSDLASDAGIRTGTLFGSYLTGGTIEIVEAEDLGLKDVTTVFEGSNDQMLNFSLTLTKPVPSGTKLHFKVTKPLTGVAALNAKTTESRQLEYVVSGPAISDIAYDSATRILTLTGEGFAGAPANLAIKLHPPTGDDLDIKPFMDSSSTDKLVVFKVPALTTAGCWRIQLSMGAQTVLMPEDNGLLVSPAVTKATLGGTAEAKQIIITGTGLDSVDCAGGALSYTLANADESKTFKLGNPTASSNSTKVTFALPALATGADKTWKVKVLFGGKPAVDPIKLTVPD